MEGGGMEVRRWRVRGDGKGGVMEVRKGEDGGEEVEGRGGVMEVKWR